MATIKDSNSMKNLLSMARGEKNGELLLKGGSLINTISGEIYKTNVLISDGIIVGVGDYENGDEILDITGLYISPGFIDGHVHVESSMMTPENYGKTVIKKGTTTIIADPHEITNVLGEKGIDYIIEAGNNSLINFFIMIPSCVPATHLETSGAVVTPETFKKYMENKNVLGLGEMMNFPGAIYGDNDVVDKLISFRDKIIDGHAPAITGKELNAYILGGISSDHECITIREALEKLRLGMSIMIREGSATKNLEDLLPFINQFNDRDCFFATDDRHVDDLMDEGHINYMIKRSIESNGNIIRAIRLATINGYSHYKLKDYGIIAPGKIADIVIIDDFHSMGIKHVIKNGKIVLKNGELISDGKKDVKFPDYSLNIKNFSIERLKIKSNRNKKSRVNVIEIVPDQIITKKVVCELEIKNGEIQPDIENDILKLAVIERHKGSGNIGLGFVKGLGIKGAIASTIAHDSHNLIVAGSDDKYIKKAIDSIIKMGGGISMVSDDLLIELPLPIGGLMSNLSAEKLYEKMIELKEGAKKMNSIVKDPFMTLSFLALPVIPEIKLTDCGLVDISKFDFIPIEVG